MSIAFDKAKRAYRFHFNRVIGGVRHRATKLLPAAWSQARADAYDRQECARLYAEATGLEKPRLELAGAVQLYLDHRIAHQRAGTKAGQHLAQLLPDIEGAPLDAVAAVAAKYAERVHATLAPATIRNRLAYLKAAVRYAYRRHGYGDRDYTDRILLPTVRNERQVYLRVPAVRKLLGKIADLETRAVFTLAFWCGLRWVSEVLPRTAADIERRRGQIWLNVGQTKNGTPRMAPIHPESTWALEHLPFERHWRDYYKGFEAARQAAGMVHVRAHDLRHSLASEIISSGGTLVDVQAALHHESALTARRYAHLYPERVRQILLGVGKRRGRAAPKNAHRRKDKSRKKAA